MHVISTSLMYLLITTQLSRFPRLYLRLPFVVGNREFLHDILVFFPPSSLILPVPISRFTRASARSCSRVISIFLAYLLITMQLSRFPVYPYPFFAVQEKEYPSVCSPHLFEISRSARWRLSRALRFERSNVKKVDEMLSNVRTR